MLQYNQDEKSCNTKTKLFTYQSFQNVLSFPLLQAAQVCIYSDAIFHSSTIQEKRQYFQKAVFSSSFTLRLSLEWKSFIKLYSVLYIVCTFLYKKLYLDMLKDGFGVKRASCSLHLKLVK